jgi:hypothetical protein
VRQVPAHTRQFGDDQGIAFSQIFQSFTKTRAFLFNPGTLVGKNLGAARSFEGVCFCNNLKYLSILPYAPEVFSHHHVSSHPVRRNGTMFAG